ncbi:MAG: P63C domain-containing protein [Novipirellula sp. JB048]
MAKKKAARSEISSQGGKARAEKLTPEERSQIAKQAADARWSGIPVATHGDAEHPLKIGDAEIPCYVLEDGTRVVSQRGLQTSVGMNVSGGAQRLLTIMGRFASKGVDTKGLESRISEPIVFRPPQGGKAHGYEATVLVDFCEVVLRARDKNALASSQKHVAKQCEILLRGFARIGIIALVDEATGYQEDRARGALAEILEAFISEELRKWVKTFPDEYFNELARLRGIPLSSVSVKRPQYFGHLTNSIVYKRLAPGIKEELSRLTPRTSSGNRKHKFFQRLSDDVGHPKLREHLASVIALMKASDDYTTFEKLLDRALPKYQEMPLFNDQD